MTLVNSKLVIFIQAKFHSLLFVLLVLIILLANSSPLPVFSQRAALSSLNQSQPQEPDLDNLKFKHLTSEDGLSSNRVISILVDSKGFLWFGTFDGLNRYDGYEFTVFKHDPTDPNSLSQNHILSLYEDSQGVLWVGTEGGALDRYDPNQKTFIHFGQEDSPCLQPGIFRTQRGDPSSDEIVEAMGQNYCRCGCYTRIFTAVEIAAKETSIQQPVENTS